MSAISSTILSLAHAGDQIAAIKTLYGGTTALLADVLPDYGVTTSWVEDADDPASYGAAITEATKAVYVESLGNPSMNIVDLEAVATVAHAHGVPLVVDNTFATPYLFRPFEHGADIVCHSATKYLGGHGTTVGGLVVEKGGFDWRNGRFPHLVKFLDEMVKTVPAAELERTAFTRRLRIRYMNQIGTHMSPLSAFLTLQGVETLSLRMRRHVDNALAVARFLERHPRVFDVAYSGLVTSPYHGLAQRYFPDGAGAIMTFRVHGGVAEARRVLERVHVWDYMVNLGDTKSMIVHPATSIHHGLTEQQQAEAGVYPDTLRLSVGTEDPGDLIRDLAQALEG